MAGCYDERSDRAVTLGELIDRGYQDAYRQFIDPVVGASGERLEMGGGRRTRGAAPPADGPARSASVQVTPGERSN
jgi:hypothetical protein